MIYFVLLVVEVVIMFLLSRQMSKTLSRFTSTNFLSFLLLPGVIIHELSHLFSAVILFVPVGHIEFTPRKSEDGLKLGSVEIAKTDPIRRSIIGFAPVLFGALIVLGIVYLFTNNILFFKDKNPYIFLLAILGVGYLLFAISNTMFSSRADMEGTLEILITLLIIFAAAYMLGFRPQLAFVQNLFTKEIVEVVRKSTIFLIAPVIIDLSILGTIKVFTGSRSRI